jgi:NMD protein affecting ribosome stability and mRNA decay
MTDDRVCAECGSLYDANREGYDDLCDRCYNFEEEED